MTSEGLFQLDCIHCRAPVIFSLGDLAGRETLIACSGCGQKYGLGDERLKAQLKQFAALVRQIHRAEGILGDSCVAIDVGPHNVKVPLKLLLTRFKSILDLQVGDQRMTISFRVNPETFHTIEGGVAHEPA